MSYLELCAIFRDEAPYLREWIEFHRLVGVEHFHLYDDHSLDSSLEVLHDYIQTRVVTYTEWFGDAPAQLEAYHDAIRRQHRRPTTTWLAFLDVDEFLFSPTYLPVSALLGRFEYAASVGVNWCMFGTSHQEHRLSRTIRSYLWRAQDDNPVHRHVKSIVQPARVRAADPPPTPHHFLTSGLNVDTRHHQLAGAFAEGVDYQLLRVNHYWTRSRQEAAEKAQRARADTGELRSLDAMLDDSLNAVYDATIGMYVPLLEARLLRA